MNLDRLRIPFMLLIVIVLAFIAGFSSGDQYKQDKIKDRFLAIPESDCYSETDVEIVIFGESQL